MSLNCGIVGLPNVGKSTLFNALTAAKAEAANYPFCTIDPNIGVAIIPDKRLDRLAQISASKATIYPTLKIVDIAGLVRGASAGEGLGNEFLGHIRTVDAIVHIVRLFKDDDVSHVMGDIDPVRDLEIIETELILKDIESVDNKIAKLTQKAKTGDKKIIADLDRCKFIKSKLESGILLKDIQDETIDYADLELSLLTSKPAMIVCNISEEDIGKQTDQLNRLYSVAKDRPVLSLCGNIEAEIAKLDPEERLEYLASYSLDEPLLNHFLREGYALLDLITFFTTGPKESRAWTIRKGTKAPQAAGVIHSDFERGFIRAEVISYDDLDRLGSEHLVKEKGLLRVEGKGYVMQPGDVCHFRINV